VAVELGPAGQLVRIRRVERAGRRVFVELPNGNVATIDADVPDNWEEGAVLLFTNAGGMQSADIVPPELWPEEVWVGVVRLKLDDVTIVEVNSQLRRLPPSVVEYKVGNTVEGRNTTGVTRVLSQDPLRLIELPDVDESVADRFMPPEDQEHLSFDDFGGFPHLVRRGRDLIEQSLKNHDALLKIGVRPVKGVLFTGPPGTGKTMLARIIASQTEAVFYQISGPAIFSKWYGESEKILRAIFKRAAEQERSIIFFDEIDSVAIQRSGDAHEASKRVVAQLLTEMDGFTRKDNVVVIAATNRPEDIDIALMRPGRFDLTIEFTLPGRRDRQQILETVAKGYVIEGDLPQEAVAANTAGWNGAELAAIFGEAGRLAVKDGRESIVAEDYLGGYARIRAQRVAAERRLRSGA